MKLIETDFFYPVEADRLWSLATSYDALARVMKGIVAFDGLPEGHVQTGQKLDVGVSLFGVLPNQPYRMEILKCDGETMIMQSQEIGAGVKSWHHRMQVVPTENGSRLRDHVEIDAGWATPVFALWARYLYNARHKPRLRLLESGAF